MRKYVTIMRTAAAEQLLRMKSLMARLVLLAVMLAVFNAFWNVVGTEKTNADISAVNFIWYLLLGAILQFGRPEGLHRRIEEDVRSGNIAYLMMRPVSFIGYKCCESLGTFCVRLPVLLIAGAGIISFLTNGALPSDIKALPVIIPLLFGSMLLLSLGTVFVGLSALYLQDSLPLFWLVQKGEYILGGLFFPLTFYPDTLFRFALATPFGAAGYRVTSLIYHYTPENALTAALTLGFWITVMTGLNHFLFYILKRKVSVNGG